MHDAIVRSCDVYFYQLGLRIGLERLADFMSKLQLSEKTGIDLPQERRGLFPDRGWYDRRFGTGRWSRGLTLNVAIGQGEVSLTPVKLAQLAAFVGNGGVLWKPHLVRSVASGASAQAYDSLRQAVPVSPYNLEAVRSAMASVVSDPSRNPNRAP